jgi:nitrogen fixation NifU-like protein
MESGPTTPPKNLGAFPAGTPSVGTGIVTSSECGDVVKLQVQVNAEGVITDARFKTYGCGSAIASSAYVTELLKGKTLAQADALRRDAIMHELSLPPVKVNCAILAEDAVKAAIADFRRQQEGGGA